jgi:aspartyl-tRNA(Asn)/glutamyl-tRNA(Gln) amidotransferase subunit A
MPQNAAGLCLAALGSDTGGSIRQPAAFCGIVGLKPTYSRVSRYGLIAYASSFDQIGPLTNIIEDAALLLEVIAGAEDFDSTVSSKSVEKYSKLKFDNKPKRIAYIKEYLESKGLDGKIKELIEGKIVALKEEGHIVDSISFPYLDYLVPTYYVITTAEASSNLARYDGVKYGFRADGENLIDMYEKTRSEGFGAEVQRRIMIGTYVLSSGYYDAYYLKAQKVRKLIKNDFDEAYKKVDAILTPSTPSSAFKIGEKKNDPVSMYLNDIFTVPVNLAGLPAISIPAGLDAAGYPLGLQIIGKAFQEQEILNLAYAMEDKINYKNKITDWWIK